MPEFGTIWRQALVTIVVVYAIRYLRASNNTVGMLFPQSASPNPTNPAGMVM